MTLPVEDDDNLAKPPEKQEMECGVILDTIQKKVFFQYSHEGVESVCQ